MTSVNPSSTNVEDILLTSPAAGVAQITLNQEATRNSLSLAMLNLLMQRLEEVEQNSSYKVVILNATGRVFSAGHNLKEVQGQLGDHQAQLALFQRCAEVMQKIVNLPKPVIASVRGVATAAGCQLVASCDLAVATEDARFATPGVNIGLFCSTPMVALSRNVPAKIAMEMLLTGQMLSADRALAYGLVNKLVADADLETATLEMAELIASKSAKTLAIGKEAFYQQLNQPLEEAYAYTAKVMATNLDALDAHEGICAFVEKRHPVWQDK